MQRDWKMKKKGEPRRSWPRGSKSAEMGPLSTSSAMTSGRMEAARKRTEKGPNSRSVSAEAGHAAPGEASLVLRCHKGFGELAIEHGLHLVPVYTFGDNDLGLKADEGNKAANVGSLTYDATRLHLAVLVVEAERRLVDASLAPLRGRLVRSLPRGRA